MKEDVTRNNSSNSSEMKEYIKNILAAMYIVDLLHEDEMPEEKNNEFQVMMGIFNHDKKYDFLWNSESKVILKLKFLFEKETNEVEKLMNSKKSEEDFKSYYEGFKNRKSEMKELLKKLEEAMQKIS